MADPIYQIRSKRLADAIVQLPRLLHKVDNFRGPGVRNEPEAMAILPQTEKVPAAQLGDTRVALVRITGNATGGGKYIGIVLNPPFANTISASGNLIADDIGYTAGAEEVLILNTAEVGQNTHDITFTMNRVNTFPAVLLPGKLSDDDPPKRVFVIFGFDVGGCQ